MRETIIRKIEDEKIIAIVRGFYGEQCAELAKALAQGGVGLMEVTFPQSDPEMQIETARTIEKLAGELGNVMRFGAGTVTTAKLVKTAYDAGAEFIISPNTSRAVIEETLRLGMVSVPGAMTPTEIEDAYEAGADFVKVFPADFLGPAFFKSVHAPLDQVKLLAVGGVNENNICDYLDSGACGAGVAGCLFKKDWVRNGQWDHITKAAEVMTGMIRRRRD